MGVLQGVLSAGAGAGVGVGETDVSSGDKIDGLDTCVYMYMYVCMYACM